MARDRNWWRALVNRVINFQDLKKVGIFLLGSYEIVKTDSSLCSSVSSLDVPTRS
jgi:hypothetical protein